MWDTIKSIEEPEPIQKKDIFFLGKELRKTRFYMDVHKKKKRHWVPPPQTKQAKGEFFNLFCIVLAAWPSGKAGDCKSFSPRFKSGCRLINKRRKIPYSLCSYNFVHNGEMWRERLLILLLDMSLRILFCLCLMFADSTKNSIRTSSN